MIDGVNWFEIPTANFERAVQFYTQVFQKELNVIDAGERKLALMPPGSGPESDVNPAGSLLHTAGFEPGASGPIIYLDPQEGLDVALGRVEAAGGKIDTPKTRIGHGYLATFIDSEGNTIGFLEWDQA